MKILVLGANGMLGSALCRHLSRHYEVVGAVRDATRHAAFFRSLGVDLAGGVGLTPGFPAVGRLLQDVKSDVVINCTGVVKQSVLAQDAEALGLINTDFPRYLAGAAECRNRHVIHISTDCVFSGARGFYSELDRPDPIDLYGETKRDGEVTAPNVTVLRTSFIGPELDHRNGLLEWLIAQRGKSVKGFARAIFSGLTSLEMAGAIQSILADPAKLAGLWHVAGPAISKFDLLNLINAELQLGITIAEDRDFVCDRSLNGSRFSAASGYVAPSWPEMIRAIGPEVRVIHSVRERL